jgi:primosomal protein N' (replication factor Y)
MPALVAEPFDYLVPQGTAEGALVEATLAGRILVGAVWETVDSAGAPDGGLASPRSPDGSGSRGPSVLRKEEISKEKKFTLKAASRVIDTVPPLRREFRQWLDWVSDFTLAPKGAVLSLCGLAHAAKTTRKKFTPPTFTIALPTLTDTQQAVAQQLVEGMRNGEQGDKAPPSIKPVLLDGVTGSGKTEVYFHAVAAALGGDVPRHQVLVLLPEIALTHQWLARFEQTFGAAPVVWHSRMTPAAKARAWQAVSNGQAPVVVGARSALFLPFANLRLIIVDEEHDPSYKQEDGVLYHARDMAVVRAHFERIPILLASATPSLETMENVRNGKYRALHLPERFGSAGLPTVQLVDLRNEPPERGDFISPTVKQAMLATLARGEQVLFFLNRRGYAPLLLCRACGHRFECSQCSAWLVVHGRQFSEGGEPPSKTYLGCHHCGHKEPMPKACPSCGATHEKLAPCGPGVERIAQEVAAMFATEEAGTANELSPRSVSEPLAAGVSDSLGGKEPPSSTPKIALLSSDESIAPETWADIEAGRIDILVGTQMVAKGHHFPRLTLVVVVDADVGLDGADLRAGERSYQLLHQLGGRAGRGERLGTVLVQTYAPEHPVMAALVAHDRNRLMALEARERKAGGWPPFGQLAAIVLDGVDEAKVKAAGQALARLAPEDARIRVLGPAPAALSKLRGQYRYRLLVKAGEGIHLQRTLRNWLSGKKFSGVRIKVDVNPYYFM